MRLVNLQFGTLQIGILGQAQRNEFLQLGIREELLPLQIGNRLLLGRTCNIAIEPLRLNLRTAIRLVDAAADKAAGCKA